VEVGNWCSLTLWYSRQCGAVDDGAAGDKADLGAQLEAVSRSLIPQLHLDVPLMILSGVVLVCTVQSGGTQFGCLYIFCIHRFFSAPLRLTCNLSSTHWYR